MRKSVRLSGMRVCICVCASACVRLHQGIFEVECDSAEDVLAVFGEGTASRRKAPHELNQDSSRSHSLFTVQLISQGVDPDLGTPVCVCVGVRLCVWLESRCQCAWNWSLPVVHGAVGSLARHGVNKLGERRCVCVCQNRSSALARSCSWTLRAARDSRRPSRRMRGRRARSTSPSLPSARCVCAVWGKAKSQSS